MEYNEILKYLRLSYNYTQEKIAKLCNVDQTTYSLWERKKTQPSIENIIKLSNFYKVSPSYILGIEDEAGISIVNSGLTDEEQRLIDYYRALPPELRSGVMTYTQTFYELDNKANSNKSKTEV